MRGSTLATSDQRDQMSITIDLDAGEVRLADTCLTVVADASATAPGALRMADGGIIKPLDYAARASLCAFHTTPGSLGRAVLAAAADGITAPSPALEALALHLAGADLSGKMPGFSDTAWVMSQIFGWRPSQLGANPARMVDGLAVSALAADADQTADSTLDDAPNEGWTRYRLDAGTTACASKLETVESLRDRLATDLLRRATAPLVQHIPGIDSRRAAAPADYAAATTEPGKPADVDALASSSRPTQAEPWRQTNSSAAPLLSAPYRRSQSRSTSAPKAPPDFMSTPSAAPAAPTNAHTSATPGALDFAHNQTSAGQRGTRALAEPSVDLASTSAPDTQPRPRVNPPQRTAEASLALAAGAANGAAPWTATSASTEQESDLAASWDSLLQRPHWPGVPASRAAAPTTAPWSANAAQTARGQGTATPDAVHHQADLADEIAAQLDDEADLRGLLRW